MGSEYISMARRLLVKAPADAEGADIINESFTHVNFWCECASANRMPKVYRRVRADVFGREFDVEADVSLADADRALTHYHVAECSGEEFDQVDTVLIGELFRHFNAPLVVLMTGQHTLSDNDQRFAKGPEWGRILGDVIRANCQGFKFYSTDLTFCPKNTYTSRLLSAALYNVGCFERFYFSLVRALQRNGMGDFLA